MITVRNNNDAYGDVGPFEVESVESFADGMEPSFVIWAREAWDRLEDWQRQDMDHTMFITEQCEKMRAEFLSGLEIVT